jgi:dihydroneopterin aldolase
MIVISLENVKIFANHGIYKEEQLTGGAFEVNLEVIFEEKKDILHIDDTINYVSLYEILKNRMKVATPLLESVAMYIVEDIKLKFPHITKCTIKICKISPPVTNFHGKLCVAIQKQY